jgi:DNA-directed RNA polymerase subunit RPC12/RpoP
MATRCPRCKTKKAFVKGRLVGKQLGLLRGSLTWSLFDREEFRYQCIKCGFVEIRKG